MTTHLNVTPISVRQTVTLFSDRGSASHADICAAFAPSSGGSARVVRQRTATHGDGPVAGQVGTGELRCVATGELRCVGTGELWCVDTGDLRCVGTGDLRCVGTGDLRCVGTDDLRCVSPVPR